MKIKTISDLHLDFRNYKFDIDLEDIDVLILAGDTAEGLKHALWLLNLLDMNPNLHIIEVAGNHTFYNEKSTMEATILKLRQLSQLYSHYHFLEDDFVIIDGVKFIGSCFWTNFNNMNPNDIQRAWKSMNDYNYINCEIGRITPYFINNIHEKSKEYIFKELDKYDGKSIVITHHLGILTDEYNDLKYAYEVDLSKEIEACKNKPLYWFSGHTHESMKKKKHGINFISNQVGYPPPYERGDSKYNKDLIIEV